MKIKDKAWFQEQRIKLDHIEWLLQQEEDDPLFDDKMDLILNFFEKEGIGSTNNRIFNLMIKKFYKFLSEHRRYKLNNFLKIEQRLN